MMKQKLKIAVSAIAVVSITVVLVSALSFFTSRKQTLLFESVCEDTDHEYYSKKYCANVGKRAYSLPSVAPITEIDYGPIIGVSWRKINSIISNPGQKTRYSKRNSYYYIIGTDDKSYQFLRLVHEIDPR